LRIRVRVSLPGSSDLCSGEEWTMAALFHHENQELPQSESVLALEASGEDLRRLAREREVLDLVPSGDVLFALVQDGSGLELTWLADGREYRLRDLVRARRLSQRSAEEVEKRLAWARRSHADAQRHRLTLEGRGIDVVRSEHLAAELRRIVTEVIT
jgi:hypothetical protein